MNVKERDENGLLINKTENGAAIVKETTGINLIAGVYSFNPSTGKYTGGQAHVLITPKKITMGASELRLMAASKINLLVSTGNKAGTSSILLDADKGIYVGSGAGIRLYSGTATPEVYVGPTHKAAFNKGDYWIQTSSVSNRYEYSEENSNYYANIIIDEEQYPTNMGFDILNLWIADNRWDEYYSDEGLSPENGTQGWTAQTGTARATAIEWIKSYRAEGATVELNKEHLMFGFNEVTKNSSDGSMMEFTKEYIVLGVGATNRALRVTGVSGGLTGVKITNQSIGMAVTNAAILMDDNGVTVGSGVNLTTSNLKGASGSFVRVCPDGVFIGSTANLYIDTGGLFVDTTATGHIFELKQGNTTYLYYDNNVPELYVHGQIRSENFVAQAGDNGNKFKADSSSFGLYNANDGPILTISGNNLVVANSYTLTVGGNITINSANLIVNPAASGNETLFKAMNGTNGIIVEGDGDTIVTGTINATGGRFINDIYVDGTIHGGTISGGTITGGSITIINDNTNNGTVTIGSGDNIFTFDQSGNLTIHGALTATSLTVGDGTYLSYSSSNGLNIGSGGLTYTTSGGLTVTGKIHANELWITDPTNNTEQSATDWVNAKVTPEAIWLGVVKHTTNNTNATIASQSHIALSDDSITIDSSGSINLNGASLTLTSSSSNVISMTTNGIALSGGTISLDGTSSITMASGGSIVLTSASFYINAAAGGEKVVINDIGIGLTSSNLNVSAGQVNITANSAINIISGGVLNLSSTNLTINSAPANGGYVINSHNNFLVDARGYAWINKLAIYDPNNEISGTHENGYIFIDFSSLAFKDAVTVSLSCNGQQTITAKAKLWGRNGLEASSTTTATISGSLSAARNAHAWGYGDTTVTINCGTGIGTLSFPAVVDATDIAGNAADIVETQANNMSDACEYSPGSATFKTPNGVYQSGDGVWSYYQLSSHNITLTLTNIDNNNGRAIATAIVKVDNTQILYETESVTVTSSGGGGGGGDGGNTDMEQ